MSPRPPPPPPELPPEQGADELEVFRPAWWRSRKFWGAVVTSAAAWASALASGGVSVPVALAASSPLLLWMGIEGAVDTVSAARRR